MPVCLGGGSGVYFFIPDWPIFYIYMLLGITLFSIFLNYFTKRSYLLYGLSYFFLGFCAISLRVHFLETPFIDKVYEDIPIAGVVDSIADRDDEGQTVILSELEDSPISLTKVRLSLKPEHESKLEIGDKVGATVTLFPIRGPVYPGSLDLRRKYFFESISAQGILKEVKKVEHSKSENVFIKIASLRRRITETFYRHMPGEEGAIAAALVTGERSKISKTTRQAFVDAGIAHILAISGLHLSIIAGFVFFFIRGGLAAFPSVAESWPIKKLAAFMSIITTFFYLLISGTGYPSIRAFVMTAIVMLGIIVDRRALSMRTLAIAAFLIILIYPESVISASFQLSFAAVIALVAFYEACWEPFYEWTRAGGVVRKTLAYPLGVMASTLVATLATTPFTIFLFNRFTLQAIFGNLLAIPLTSFMVMPVAFFATISQLFGEFSGVFWLFGLAIKSLIWVAEFVAGFPGAALLVPSPPLWSILLSAFGALWLCLSHGRKRLYGIIPIMLSFAGFWISTPPDVLVSDKVIGFYQNNKLYLSSDKGWFEKVMWQRHLGLREDQVDAFDHPIIEASQGIFLMADPKELSYKNIKQVCFYPNLALLITNGYVDRICKNLQPYNFSKSTQEAKSFISKTELDHGVVAIWLSPLRVQKLAEIDRGKPWGTGH